MFWQVGSSATLGTGTVLAGNILALTSITMNDGVTLNGRALARNGAVTLIDDTITAPHCASRGRRRELDVSARCRPIRASAPTSTCWPNDAVEAALVRGGLDPTRANWTKGTWGQSSWSKGTWGKGTWGKGTWGAADERHRCAVGARHLERADMPGGPPRPASLSLSLPLAEAHPPAEAARREALVHLGEVLGREAFQVAHVSSRVAM